jgi:hypothetical protein
MSGMSAADEAASQYADVAAMITNANIPDLAGSFDRKPCAFICPPSMLDYRGVDAGARRPVIDVIVSR